MTSAFRRLQEKRRDGEEGFTLIELLVVIIIIGILAAIAIPVYLNQRQKAFVASVKSDLQSAATSEEAYYTDAVAYVAGAPSAVLTNQGFKLSPNNVITVTAVTATSFCAVGYNVDAGATNTWRWRSDTGGLTASGSATGTC
jgi:prepilin-type N-terminal cleavage/methylation domain-containing protein